MIFSPSKLRKVEGFVGGAVFLNLSSFLGNFKFEVVLLVLDVSMFLHSKMGKTEASSLPFLSYSICIPLVFSYSFLTYGMVVFCLFFSSSRLENCSSNPSSENSIQQNSSFPCPWRQHLNPRPKLKYGSSKSGAALWSLKIGIFPKRKADTQGDRRTFPLCLYYQSKKWDVWFLIYHPNRSGDSRSWSVWKGTAWGSSYDCLMPEQSVTSDHCPGVCVQIQGGKRMRFLTS